MIEDSNKSCQFIPLQEEQKKKPKKNHFVSQEQKEKRKQKRARVIVRNISYKATEEIFREYFQKFGIINDCQLLKKSDGKLVGCGFIQFETVNQAAKAILKGNNSCFLGRQIIVDWALAKNEFEKRRGLTLKKDIKKEENDDTQKTEKDKPFRNKNNKVSNDEKESELEYESNTENEEKLFKNNSDDEDSSSQKYMDDDEEDEVDYDKDDKTKKDIIKLETQHSKFKSNDVKDGCTVFLKNVPFDATSDDLKKLCRKYGPIFYAIINKDSISGHSRGTAFVKFKTQDSAGLCLRAGENFALMDQVIEVLPALSREDVQSKNKKDKHNDARNLYLIKEGIITTGSKAADGVSASDMAKRHQIEQVKGQVLKNLNRFVSRNRLSIHNLPLDYDDEKLKNMIIKQTQLKPHECRIIRENKTSIGFPNGKPKGFGFMSFRNHKEALVALRILNNNPQVFGSQNRPIVGFSIEDKSVHNIKKKRMQKSRQNNPAYKENLSKTKKNVNVEKDSKIFVQHNINKLNSRKRNKLKVNTKTYEENFMGMSAKPGTFVRMRSEKKIRQQSQEHKKKLGDIKRKAKKQKERKFLRLEAKSIDRPKQGKKKEQNDNFSLLVNKYKKLIDVKSEKAKKSKRTKWYLD